MNTPQFEHVKTRLPRRPRPVPPIYQPEVAADAIVWAADHTPRDLYVGFSTLTAVTGNKFVPGLVDRYLAHSGYEAQQTSEPIDPKRPDNLWRPVGGDAGAHGHFNAEARSRSLHFWTRKQRSPIAVGVGAAALAALGRRLR